MGFDFAVAGPDTKINCFVSPNSIVVLGYRAWLALPINTLPAIAKFLPPRIQTMAMNLLLESLSRCLNGTSTVRGSGGAASSAGLGNANDDDQFEPAAVQVRLRDHARRSTSSRSRRRSTTPKNRNGRRRSAYDEEEEEDLAHAEADDVDMLADARRDAHQQAGKEDEDRPSTSNSRRRRRQRSAPKLTVEERRNDIFRLPSDHPASRPSSPADNASPNSTSRSRSSPRIHVVTPEPLVQPLGLMCGRTSPAVVFRRGSSAPSSSMSMSNLLRDSTGGLRALCFASPVRDSHEAADEQQRAAANAAINSNGYAADDRTVDTFSILHNEGTDDPTVNTADYTYATQDDTVASTHYFDAKLAHMVETSPPMPLYRQYEVTDTNPDHDIRKIVETNSHRSIKEAGVDLAGGLINVVKKKWSSPERTGRAAPQSRSQSQPQARRESSQRESRRQPTTSTTRTSRATARASSSRSPSSSPTARPKKTSSNDPPTPPRRPRGYREEVVVAAAARGRRSTSGGGKLGGHPNPSEDSSVPSLEFSRNSSQSTSPSI